MALERQAAPLLPLTKLHEGCRDAATGDAGGATGAGRRAGAARRGAASVRGRAEGGSEVGGCDFVFPRSGAGSEPRIESGPGLLSAPRGSGGVGGRAMGRSREKFFLVEFV